MNLEKVKEIYTDSEVCMGETLANIPADGLSLEEAFELYIQSMQWCEGDKFFRQIPDGEMEELLSEG